LKKHMVEDKLIQKIAFFGDSAVDEGDPVYKDAYEAAKVLASAGYTIVNGGGPGVMNASTEGAESVHGTTISVTFYPENATGFEGRYARNVTDKEIVTKDYIERMFGLMENADLFIMFKGGSGTISELGTAWVLAKLYYGHHKPFILFGSFWRQIVNTLEKNLNIDEKELDVFRIVEKQEELIPVIDKFEKELSKVDHSHCKVCGEKAYMT